MGTEIVHVPRADVVRAEDFMPVFTVQQAVDRKKQMNQFINDVMVEGEDYGPMPGDNRKDKKKVLLKPGAEKLCSIFGLAPRYVKETVIEDWTGAAHGGEPLFYYEYRCQLYRGDRFMGEGIGSCNSWEAKYRWRWVAESQLPEGVDKSKLVARGGRRTLSEFLFAFDKRETTGQYGKPEEHWQMFEAAVRDGTARKVEKETKNGKRWAYEIDVDQTLYRMPNPDFADMVNTCQKIGQKRAQVAAVLVVTNCSDAFTQDLEDTEPEPTGMPHHQQNGKEEQSKLAEQRIAEEKERSTAAIPKELKGMLDAIAKNPASAAESFQLLYDRLATLGAPGIKAYERIESAFHRKFPKGTTDAGQLQACISDLYHAVAAVEKEAAPVQGELVSDPV